MFCKTSLLTIALALLATAAPITHESGLRIPLSKRGSLTKPDGTFDREKAIRASVKLQNKHRQNMLNLQRNVGLPEGVRIPELATVPESAQKRRQALPLTDQDDNVEWTGTVSIGTPGQNFVIDFDTGSSDLWVPLSSCSECSFHNTYDTSASSTSQEISEGSFQIEYQDGSSASGNAYVDSVSVAGVSVTGQALAGVTQESGEFQTDPADGLMGMAFQAISSLNAQPFFFTAIEQNAVQQSIFSMKLSSSGAELYVGGVDSSLYNGDIEYHSISSSAGYWQIGGASATVNGQTVGSGFDTIIDSGTTLMYGPADDVADFYSAIEGSQEYDTQNGLYSFPCSSSPSISFSWGGASWSISADDFNVGEVSDGQCQGALGVQDLGDNTWLLGDTFMTNVYTAFDGGNNAVGFAQLS